MKIILLLTILISTSIHARDKLSGFSRSLNETVQKELKNENNDRLKSEKVGRGPASVGPEKIEQPIRDLNKFEKQDSQKTGSNRW